MRTVRARLVFPPTGVRHVLPQVSVGIEDVSWADAAAAKVGEAFLTAVEVPSEGMVVEVDVPAEDPVMGHRYSVRAHGGQGTDVQQGDFLTTQSVPVALEGDEAVDVPLRYLG